MGFVLASSRLEAEISFDSASPPWISLHFADETKLSHLHWGEQLENVAFLHD
jgi:hypothetical protein